MKKVESHKLHGGELQVWQHTSATTHTEMKFAIYLPPKAIVNEATKTTETTAQKFAVLYWLSGLTCTEQNFIQKSGFAGYASRHNVIVVAPDTSPRGVDISGNDVPDDSAYDLGQGAGFYVNATQAPWATHFQMYDYIVDELPNLIEQHFPASDQRSIFGHSMGGHGALMIALRNPQRYASVSAFSPIVAPSQVPWGQKAFSAYLGDDQSTWANYDSLAWMKQSAHGKKLPLLIDQGSGDEFLAEQLKPELFAQAAKDANYPMTLRMQDGYDHSYYFISSFIADHFAHHAAALQA
ncbi:S-formylglutathione hydrolase [Moraxella sp. PS-22]|uniref:S-formylglutathione hydrolase n=1 Tax=Moraxella tetraodonis TaxID=2767221 RepID=A0A9X1USX8_9GAMM|nr:S-formylglutathione hydrolase [Moraxella tetraodonis]MCG8148510.1 S-formylglutathione hydrolase [Moraxella tetraodonis]